jgi:hypothetical protein
MLGKLDDRLPPPPFDAAGVVSRTRRPGRRPGAGAGRFTGEHDAQLGQLQREGAHPIQQPVEGRLIGQAGPERGAVRTHRDLAVVEFLAQRGACPAREGDLVHV